MSKEGFDIFTFFLFGYTNSSCLLNRIASSSLSYTVDVAPSSPSPFPVMKLVRFGLILSHKLPPVVIGTIASQSERRQLFRFLASHGTPYLPHSTCLLFVTSFATCPVSVQGALVSLPAGENSRLMMFKEAEYFPSHVRLWGRKQCLAHVSSVVLLAPRAPPSSSVGCGSWMEKTYSPLVVSGGEISGLQGLCARRCSRVSL